MKFLNNKSYAGDVVQQVKPLCCDAAANLGEPGLSLA